MNRKGSMVEIITNPDVPKTVPETLCVTADMAGRMSLQLLAYLRTGDLDHLKRATNCLLQIRTMETKNYLNQIVVCGMRGEHPFSAEERKELYMALIAASDQEMPA